MAPNIIYLEHLFSLNFRISLFNFDNRTVVVLFFIQLMHFVQFARMENFWSLTYFDVRGGMVSRIYIIPM